MERNFIEPSTMRMVKGFIDTINMIKMERKSIERELMLLMIEVTLMHL